MLTQTHSAQYARFRIGWIILVIFAALMTLNHFALIFFLDEPILFIGYAASNLYALIVVLIPFRRIEKWAWLTTWILPVALALPAGLDRDLVIFYSAISALLVLGLILTAPEFFSKGIGK